MALGRQGTADSESRFAKLPPARLEGVMPPIAARDRVDKFETELSLVAGCPHRAESVQGLIETLLRILSSCEVKSVVLTRNPLLRELHLAERLRQQGIFVSEWPECSTPSARVHSGGDASVEYREACFGAAVGISGVDMVLAETGSLILSSETEGSQLASLAPPIHVALYRREQVVSDLDDAVEILGPRAAGGRVASDSNAGEPGPAAGRSLVFVTGTSRTADIEQTLIRGVHGPRDLHAILVDFDQKMET